MLPCRQLDQLPGHELSERLEQLHQVVASQGARTIAAHARELGTWILEGSPELHVPLTRPC
eukprot:158157-Lingulodinium_polyedra.AAC.1